MTAPERLPSCPSCGKLLDRIDHYGIEHLILDTGVYRPVAINEGMPGVTGLASEVDLRCGYCAASVPREAREYFYRRWYLVGEMR